ncbi:MAG: hypothetical protein LQ350_005492 [Teloschistes chrysophthalmus]|nr:MAG: hypothetical protein LQ350_005492 [Niorma chrysophthalma]
MICWNGSNLEDRDNVDNEPSSGEGLVEEYSAAIPTTQENLQRAGRILKGRGLKDSTTLSSPVLAKDHPLNYPSASSTSTSTAATTPYEDEPEYMVDALENQLATFEQDLQQSLKKIASSSQLSHLASEETAEQTLSLIILKEDFLRMRIIGSTPHHPRKQPIRQTGTGKTELQN